MAVELSYVLITPYSLKKSRTGGIIARLLSRTGLELVAARMIAPDKAFAEAYAESLKRRVGICRKNSLRLCHRQLHTS